MKTKALIVIVFLCSLVINNLLINVNLTSALATVRINVNGRGYTEDDAIRNAIEKAIDHVVWKYYDSKTLVKDRTLLEHAMENYSKYVKYRIVDDLKKGKAYLVKLALEIDEVRLSCDLKSLMKSEVLVLSDVSVLSIVGVPRRDNKLINKIIDEDDFGVPVSSMLADALKERGLHVKNNYLSLSDLLLEGEDREDMETKKMLGVLKKLYKEGKIGIEENGEVIYDPHKIAKYPIVVFFKIKEPKKINDVEYKLGATIDVTALSTWEDIIAKKTFDCYVFSDRPKDFSRLTKKACEQAGTLIASQFMKEIRDRKIEANTLIELVVQNVDFHDCIKIKGAIKSGGKEVVEMKYNNRNCEIKVKTSDANAESVTLYELITKEIQKRTDNVSLEGNKMTIIF